MKWLRVKDWARFQHYKTRDPIWIKMYVALLTDYDFTRLEDASRAHLFGIWLLASRTDGRVPYDVEWLGKRISATSPVNLEVLIAGGFLETEEAPERIAPRKQTASNPLVQRREEKNREEESRGEPPRLRVATEVLAERFPEEYREDFHAHLRASHRPEALVAEIKKILDGDEPACKGAGAKDVGVALRDIALAGKTLTGSLLRGFVRGAMQRRDLPPTPFKAERPEDDFDAAIRSAQAKEASRAR